ncbi:hypothetical protein [Paraglaciecola sp. MB-3u-78]|uniref:hypothetical protein n=1 Tax=Paraglaciecola sp. MB-3u-78 TaxID=2058332 RepID=UPI0012FEE48F|nr:hypothetical protein [Paraglaciecola sp. MB-3u-78]
MIGSNSCLMLIINPELTLPLEFLWLQHLIVVLDGMAYTELRLTILSKALVMIIRPI